MSYNEGEPKGYCKWYTSVEDMQEDNPEISELEYIEIETEIYINNN